MIAYAGCGALFALLMLFMYCAFIRPLRRRVEDLEAKSRGERDTIPSASPRTGWLFRVECKLVRGE